MTVYTILVIILALWNAVLAVLGEREKTKKLARRGDIITAVVGVIAAVAGVIIALVAVSKQPAGDFADWAKGVEKTFFTIILPVFGILFLICVLTSLMSWANKKLSGGFPHKIRVIMIAVSAVFILGLSLVSYIATNDTLPLDAYLFAVGAGLACVMRVCSIIENRGKTND